jgi:membrane-bound ClpP family serine protease
MEVFLEHLPAILMLVVGFGLVVVEMYIPGFGAPGLLGSILLILGVYFTAQNIGQALIMVIVIIALLCLCLTICLRSASKGRLAKSKLVLNEVSTQEPEVSDLDYFVGKVGIAHTVLRPSGMAEFDGVKLNVVSDGEFIGAGKKVRVERVEGNRILVKQAD